ncbi:hypothetical protein HAX54_009350 [Datura stramonium]|uniref:Zeta toxin domain-containing protein n=1 Tax=Datura stramonium TaxID=4076 RepID=A0ABS8TES7_DATST|nr:hypothetical protein [Datura stramonium]
MHHLTPKLVDHHMIINQLAPILDTSECGRAASRVEKFSHYVARQLGFKDESECPGLSELVQEYLKRSRGCDNTIFEYFADEEDAESLYVKLENELERCILAYFAFHWSKASMFITQVLSVDSEQKRLKDLVLAATREQRFEKITKDLKVTRVFSTLVEEMKAIGTVSSNGNGESRCTDVMVPVVHSQRSPVLLLMGGGMGAGKSTVLKDILKQRAISTGRAVRVQSQLKSHKRFANAFPNYCDLVDNARLYCTNALGSKPSLIAWKDGENKMLVEPEDIKCLEMVKKVKEEAESIYELYEEDDVLSQSAASIWKDIVLIPTRSTLQQELKTAILKIENRGK